MSAINPNLMRLFIFCSTAIWMMPSYNAYGTWPASGEIDILESRGNRDMYHHGQHIGTQEAGSTMHFGPTIYHNGWDRAHWVRRDGRGWNNDFHRYQLEWTPGSFLPQRLLSASALTYLF